ncbi:hypothetical protein GKE82_13955 [Conexibacter sp. W3-3-2]|uniref:hypothetical protein n=1 Tax=Conexibacter sp. W3-3-2 TaxID=2675227 RepID=UPI0012B97D3D|nr:hypothetical protein [Conexibacter sp. W3-3-2]MTD45360.1 hypothetical protein [Conexibacter sp. W3-3-2]
MPSPNSVRPTPQPRDPHAVARERLAARARRLRTLRLRAAGGAVGVFLAAWLALFVPAQGASSSSTSTQAASPATGATDTSRAVESTTGTDDGWSDETYDSGTTEDGWSDDTSTDQGWSDDSGSTAGDSSASVPAAPMTSGQS